MVWVNTFKDLSVEEKEALIIQAYETGYSYEAKYGNCAQCTLAALEDVFGCGDEILFKAAYGLAGGLGLTSRGVCGALNGAALLIGLLYGRDRAGFTTGARNPQSYLLSRKLLDRFCQLYDGCLCHEVQKKVMGRSFDLSVREEYKAFEEAGGHVDKCTSVVGSTCRLFAEMVTNGEI